MLYAENHNEIEVRFVTASDDLDAVASSIKTLEWGADNEMQDYDAAGLRRYIERSGNVLLIAYVKNEVAGTLLATTIVTPYLRRDWLFIDELDTKPKFRRRGVATALMQAVFTFAKERNLSEVWLGTEHNNEANKLYQKLQPAAVEQFNGYTYKVG